MTKQRILLGSAVGVFAAMITVGVAAAAPFGPHRDGRGDHDGGPAMLVVSALAALAIVAAVAFFLRRRTLVPAAATPSPVSHTASAETILAERLARGEISPEDYRVTAAALRGEVTPPSAPEA
jgi:putative membrane protein